MSKESNRAWYEANRQTILAKQKAVREANPVIFQERIKKYRSSDKYKETYWKYWLKKNYGMTPAQYDQLFENQGKKCACCGEINPNSPRPWHLDHNHVTGIIRGILCFRCNQLIGMLGDSSDKIKEKTSMFISYLDSHE